MESAKKTKEQKLLQLMVLPLSFILGIIPIIVRMKEITPKDDIQGLVLRVGEFTDCFSQNKALVLLIVSIIMLGIWFFLYDKAYIKKNGYIYVGIIGLLIFLMGAVLSTILSEHKEVAIWGTYDRAEGMITILCYGFICLYSIYAFNEYKERKYIIIPLSFILIVNVILGVFQYFGHDLFLFSDFLKKIIVPEDMAEAREMLVISYASEKMYGTVGHYNYMGSFSALLFPFFMSLTFLIKDKRLKVVMGIMLVAALILVFGGARSGIVAAAMAVVFWLILMSKQVIKHWKVGFVVLVAAILALVGMNFATSGSVFSRVPSLVADILHVVGRGEEKVDYRDSLPMREFKNENGEVIIVLQIGQMHFKAEQGKITTIDEQGKNIVYHKIIEDENGNVSCAVEDNEQEGIYRTEDERCAHIEYEIGKGFLTETDYLTIRTMDNAIAFKCRVDYEANFIQQIDDYTGEDVYEEEAPSIGFEGSERLGSMRGYIWSRTLPMLKDTVLVGKGPDNFFAYFTRRDRLAKLAFYNVSREIIDKPHNLYLQIAVNEGIIALLGFLLLIGSYLIQSIKLYAFKSEYTEGQRLGITILTSIVGYLVAGIFNDSVVSVAPIFWVLLGIGFSVNYKVTNEDKTKEM